MRSRTWGVLTPGDTLELSWKYFCITQVVKISGVWVPYREYPRPLCCSIVFFPFFVAIFPAVLSVRLFRALQSSLQISSLASAAQFLISFSSLDSQSFTHFSTFFCFPQFIFITTTEIFVKDRSDFVTLPCACRRSRSSFLLAVAYISNSVSLAWYKRLFIPWLPLPHHPYYLTCFGFLSCPLIRL